MIDEPNEYNCTSLLIEAGHDCVYMHCRSASPCPWKNRKDSAKSAMKIRTREMTTAEVVDSPTPFAPPVVVKPQEQLTCTHECRVNTTMETAIKLANEWLG